MVTDLKERVEIAYDGSSEIYDAIISSAMVEATNKLLSNIEIIEDPVALDIGCGTGISTFELIKRCHGKGHFYGIDISRGMIEKAVLKAKEQEIENASFTQGDAESLDFEDSMFNLVISNETLHWVPDKQKVFSEIHRVLKPGGQMAVRFNGEFDHREVVSIIEKIASKNTDNKKDLEPLAHFFQTLLSLEDALSIIEGVGFSDHNIFALHSIGFWKPEVYIKMSDSFASFWQVGLSEDRLAGLRQMMLDEARKLASSKGLTISGYYIFAYAKKSM